VAAGHVKESSERVAGTTALAALSMWMGCGSGRTHQALSCATVSAA
jgi:hypothetical protein